jgi:8-oxo-dGTP diphosphatase
MNVDDTEIKVEMGRPNNAERISIATVNEMTFRKWAASKLKKSKVSVAVGISEKSLKGFKAIWAAKIWTQEILKAIRQEKKNFKTISIYLEDQGTYKVFHKEVFNYIKHITENLGKGPYVTVDLIIEMPSGIILIERSNPPLGWTLPGGFVDYGESLEEAAVREGKEETGLSLTNLKQFHTYSTPTRDPRFHTVSTVFIAKGRGTPKAGDDAQGLIVVPHQDLLKRTYPFDHKNVIRDYLEFR